jgi:hypothetical protein
MTTMTVAEAFSIAASLVSIILAIVAIWFADKQRRESQVNADSARAALAEINTIVGKVETLVSENFQNLLTNTTAQQAKMIEAALTPRLTKDEMVMQLFIKLADEPEKLGAMMEIVSGLNLLRPPGGPE